MFKLRPTVWVYHLQRENPIHYVTKPPNVKIPSIAARVLVNPDLDTPCLGPNNKMLSVDNECVIGKHLIRPFGISGQIFDCALLGCALRTSIDTISDFAHFELMNGTFTGVFAAMFIGANYLNTKYVIYTAEK